MGVTVTAQRNKQGSWAARAWQAMEMVYAATGAGTTAPLRPGLAQHAGGGRPATGQLPRADPAAKHVMRRCAPKGRYAGPFGVFSGHSATQRAA